MVQTFGRAGCTNFRESSQHNRLFRLRTQFSFTCREDSFVINLTLLRKNNTKYFSLSSGSPTQVHGFVASSPWQVSVESFPTPMHCPHGHQFSVPCSYMCRSKCIDLTRKLALKSNYYNDICLSTIEAKTFYTDGISAQNEHFLRVGKMQNHMTCRLNLRHYARNPRDPMFVRPRMPHISEWG